MYKPTQIATRSRINSFLLCLALSWFYALCSQIIIPMPFNAVPLSIQPLPLLVASLILGWPAVYAFMLYLLQGTLGAPIFAFGLGGIGRLCGPTGGYLIGFLFAAIFLAWAKQRHTSSTITLMAKLIVANLITFFCGLAQLSLFVPAHKLLSLGFFPFVIGDFVIKFALAIILVKRFPLALPPKLR